MVKTRSGKKMHNLCNNVPSKNNKKKTKNYSATDEIINDRTKVVGTRKSEECSQKFKYREDEKTQGN